MVAWGVNLVEKQLATYFGGAVTLIGMITAVGVRRAWFVDLLVQIPFIQRLQARAYRASEGLVEEELKGLVTLAEAIEVKALYPASTLLAVRDESPRLIQEGIFRAKGKGESALYCIYVEEWPGLFAGETPHVPNELGIQTLKTTLKAVREKQIEIIPIWAVSHNAAEAIANAAKALDVDSVIIELSDDRRVAPLRLLPHAARPRGQGTDETVATRLSLDDLQLSSSWSRSELKITCVLRFLRSIRRKVLLCVSLQNHRRLSIYTAISSLALAARSIN